MNNLSLHGTWQLNCKERSISIPMSIPGDTVTALLEAELIAEPFYADNELEMQWVNRMDWELSREFEIDASFLENADAVILKAQSLDTVAEIFINDRKVGFSDNMFIPFRTDIRSLLKVGENTVRILFHSAENAAQKRREEYGAELPIICCPPVQSPNRNYLRKVQCHSGWDWGPCLMVSGIYGEAELEPVENCRIEQVYCEQSFEDGSCRLTVHCECESFTSCALPFRIDAGGVAVECDVSLTPGVTTLRQEIVIENPNLWNPVGYGDPNLTPVKVQLGKREVTKQIGLRDLKIIHEHDDGMTLTVSVNGKHIFCKGANWVPCDALPSRITREAMEDLLDSAVTANMNMLRVWGGGYYETDDFYELCDRKGLLIWQDFMFACGSYPVNEEFLTSVEAEVKAQVKRLRDYACIALWCGNNEDTYCLKKGQESDTWRLVGDYQLLNEGIIGRTCRETDPGRIFWPSSPCNGTGRNALKIHDQHSGDIHFWGVWLLSSS